MRKRSFRPTLKLRFSTPNKGDYGVRKRSFRPSLKLTKACAPLPLIPIAEPKFTYG
jgi:hypothetical protein